MQSIKRFLPILTASLLLVSCSTAIAEQSTTQAPSFHQTKEPYQITEIRTPTPTLPAGETLKPNPQRPTPVTTAPDGKPQQPDKPGNVQDEMGDGAPLDGYIPLLEYIDQTSISHMIQWPNHETDDMFDGIFENTEIGSNKFGMNSNTVDVTWAMDRPVVISAYVMYTANDTESHPERNPKSWTLYGSSDGNSYEKIHSVRDANLPIQNYVPTVFRFNNSKSYQYYRWSLEDSVGGGAFQLSELLLFTKKAPPAVEEKPETPEVNDKGLPEYGVAASGRDATPLLGEDSEKWMNSNTSLQDQVKQDSIYCSERGYAPDEHADRLFDGIYTEKRFEEQGGKMCGPLQQGHIYWEMKKAVKPSAYVFVTANDTDEYPGRNPIAWVLYGATANGEWVVLDAVKNGNMVGENFAPHVYQIDNDKAYSRFCLVIEQTGIDFQLCEILLYS